MISLSSDIEIKESKGKLNIIFRGSTLASINKKLLDDIAKEYLNLNDELSDKDKKAIILSKDFNKLKIKFYSGKIRTTDYTPKHKDFKYFLQALEIIDRFDITNAVFLKAQIEGLSFTNNSMGTYPKPSQLSTEGSEERVVRYLESNGLITHQEFNDNNLTKINGEITLNKYDIETPLKKNTRYMNLLSKLKKGEATLDEALYLKKCRVERKGDAGPLIKEYIRLIKN